MRRLPVACPVAHTDSIRGVAVAVYHRQEAAVACHQQAAEARRLQVAAVGRRRRWLQQEVPERHWGRRTSRAR